MYSDPVWADGEFGRFCGSEGDAVVFGQYRRTGRWSAELVKLLAERLGAGGTLLDVGANIGLVCVPVVERSGCRALCFEPAPENFACLTANVAEHGLQGRIDCFELALSDSAGDALLGLCPDNSGDHSLVFDTGSAGAEGARIGVRTATLDATVADRTLQGPVAMKLDTQGAETRVLRGARRTLAAVDLLVCEYWPRGLARMGESATELRALLAEFPRGAVLTQDGAAPELMPTDQMLERVAWIEDDDEGFFDLLLSRDS
jgi:FkbM family methyltransferase